MTDDLVKRVREVEPDAPGERTRWYRNPDGPEAADRIEQLEAALKKAPEIAHDLGELFRVRHQSDYAQGYENASDTIAMMLRKHVGEVLAEKKDG